MRSQSSSLELCTYSVSGFWASPSHQLSNPEPVLAWEREARGGPKPGGSYRSSGPHRGGPTEGAVRGRDRGSRPPTIFRFSAFLRRTEFYKSVSNNLFHSKGRTWSYESLHRRISHNLFCGLCFSVLLCFLTPFLDLYAFSPGLQDGDGLFREAYGRLTEAYGSLRKVYGRFMEAYGSLRKLYGSLRRGYGSLRRVYGSLRKVYGGLRKANGSLRRFTEAYGRFTEAYRRFMEAYGRVTETYG